MANFEQKVASDKLTTGMSNTRRVNDFNINITSCIDYFKFRIDNIVEIPKNSKDYENYGIDPGSKDYSFIGELSNILLIKPFEYYEKLKTGYPKFYIFDEDIFYYGGKSTEVADDGTPRYYFELKGHALRQFELRCIENNIDVFEQYCKLFKFCYKYSVPSNDRNLKMLRIDLARDDFSNYITEKELRDKLEKGFYTTRSTRIQQSLNYFKDDNVDEVNEIVSSGWTAYIGSRTSRQLCIYNKAEERKSKNNIVLSKYWMRYEARFYHDNANIVFNILFLNVFKDYVKDSFDFYVGKLINCIVEFKEDNNYSKHDQSKVDIWKKWECLFGVNDLEFKVQASVEKDNTMLKSKDWLIQSPYMNITLQFLSDVNIEYDENGYLKCLTNSPSKIYSNLGVVFDDYFIKFIFALLDKGKEKLDNLKLSKVNNLRKAKRLTYIKNVYDAHKIIDFYIDDKADYGFMNTNVFQENDEK